MAERITNKGVGYGDGDGCGYGDGHGYGDGYGWGYGDGDGYGYAYGYGYGYGDENGYGYGYGRRYGYRKVIPAQVIGEINKYAVEWIPLFGLVKIGCKILSVNKWKTQWRKIAEEEDVNISDEEVHYLIAKCN